MTAPPVARLSGCVHTIRSTRPTSSTLTADSNSGSVAAEKSNIRLHPLQRKGHILQPSVHSPIPINLIRRQEAKCAESILDCYADETVIVRVDNRREILIALALSIATPMYPNQNREVGFILGRVYTQEQAVFIAGEVEVGLYWRGCTLRTPLWQCITSQYIIPIHNWWLRWLPPQRPNGCSGVSDPCLLSVQVRATNATTPCTLSKCSTLY